MVPFKGCDKAQNSQSLICKRHKLREIFYTHTFYSFLEESHLSVSFAEGSLAGWLISILNLGHRNWSRSRQTKSETENVAFYF